MFSSLTSFLPSLSIHTTSAPPLFDPNNNPEEEAECAEEEHAEDAEVGMTTKRSKNVHETFIFVRPPPAKSNHPLNLQVQLVPPAVQPRRSFEINGGSDNVVTLARTTSNRSDTSESGYGSATSFASSSSFSQSRRTIIPLYSLQAHNVMANVIVDAGTDAKVAKFHRRGMEFVDLAVLEAVEVWAERFRQTKASRPVTPETAFTTAASSTASLSSGSLSQHAYSVPRRSIEQQLPIQRQPVMHHPTPLNKGINSEPAKRNIFGKIFKKNKDHTPPAALTTLSVIAPPDPESTATPDRPASSRGHGRKISLTSNHSALGKPPSSPIPTVTLQVPGQEMFSTSTNDISVDGVPEEKIIRPPVLGIQPTVSYSYMPPGTATAPGFTQPTTVLVTPRALMYVWFVKKWLKRRADTRDVSFLTAVQHVSRKGSGSSVSSHGPIEGGVEVRFEWKRATGRGKGHAKWKEQSKDGEKAKAKVENRGRSGEKDQSRRFRSISHHRAGIVSVIEESTKGPRIGTPADDFDRVRRISFPSSQRQDSNEDAGEDSDPEDSETPWVCTLKLRRTVGANATLHGESASATVSRVGKRRPGTASGVEMNLTEDLSNPPEPGVSASSSSASPRVLRIKVGTLSPTPHHPKLVGMLKAPFPLPDVELERMGVSPRPPGYITSRPPPSQWEGTTLTAEEIKDIVCSTGLWLVVREGFGGIGRVNRKGDGWRIRA